MYIMVTTKCLRCDNPVHTTPARQAAGRGKYCSKECYRISKVKHLGSIEGVCPNCKEVRPIEQFQLERGLRHGWCRVCQRERSRKDSRRVHFRWLKGKSIAKKRGLTWEISEDEYIRLSSEKCHYCSDDLPNTGIGLDRMDNNYGYVGTNVVPCCTTCNLARGDHFSYQEMITHIAPAIRMVKTIRKANDG